MEVLAGVLGGPLGEPPVELAGQAGRVEQGGLAELVGELVAGLSLPAKVPLRGPSC
ncbi:MAG: hypothetical protein OEV94_02425 [Deltaproteobacteria bacterium]|nr:hypothetical protein [Deltaproteobacteria bacterium]